MNTTIKNKQVLYLCLQFRIFGNFIKVSMFFSLNFSVGPLIVVNEVQFIGKNFVAWRSQKYQHHASVLACS